MGENGRGILFVWNCVSVDSHFGEFNLKSRENDRFSGVLPSFDAKQRKFVEL